MSRLQTLKEKAGLSESSGESIVAIVELLQKFLSVLLLGLSILAYLAQIRGPWLAAVVIAACAVVFLYVLERILTRFSRLRLRKRRQALAWTHYRPVLAEASFRSVSGSSGALFDYITFVNGRFEGQLNGGFFTELQYISGASAELDMVIFDIEYTRDLRQPVKFDDPRISGRTTRTLIPFERFLRTRQYGSPEDLVPRLFRHTLVEGGSTYAIPLRWGVNGVALSGESNSAKEIAEKTGVEFASMTQFDLNWLLEKKHLLRREFENKETNTWLIALDWYLPTMLLLASRLSPASPHQLDQAAFRELKEALASLAPLFRPDEPLVKDPLRLAQQIRKK